MNRAIFFSYHVFISKRQGGMHHFAKALSENGYRVDFVTHITLSNLLKRKTDRTGIHLLSLFFSRREVFACTTSKGLIINYGRFLFIIPRKIMNVFSDNVLSFIFKRPIKNLFKKNDAVSLIVLESSICIVDYHDLKKRFPEAKFIYRPSDPLFLCSDIDQLINLEKKIIQEVDLTLFDSEERFNAYINLVGKKPINVKILENGYTSKVRNFKELKDYGSDLLYIGAAEPDWKLLFKVATQFSDKLLLIVYPGEVSNSVLKKISLYSNIRFLPGVKPDQVNFIMSMTSILLIPYHSRFKKNKVGLTAKVKAGIYLNKPIIAINVSKSLNNYNIYVSDNHEEFITNLKILIECDFDQNLYKNVDITFNTWTQQKNSFMNFVQLLG